MIYDHLCCRLCRVPVHGVATGGFRCPICKIEGGYENLKTFCED
jgi:hypothetical protein